MENTKQAFYLGLFILVLVVVAAGSLYWTAGGFNDGQAGTHSLVFEEDVSGLQVGQPVTLQGVEVGKVTSIALHSEEQHKVEIQAKLSLPGNLYKDTVAEIRRNPVTGLATINIQPGEKVATALPINEVGLVVIPTQPSQISRLSELGEAILTDMKNVTHVLGGVAAVFHSDNVAGNEQPEPLQKTLTEIQQTSKQLGKLATDENVESLQSSVSNLEQFSTYLTLQEEKIQQVIQQAELATANAVKITEPFATGMEQVQKQISKSIVSLKETMADTGGVLRDQYHHSTEVYADLQRELDLVLKDTANRIEQYFAPEEKK